MHYEPFSFNKNDSAPTITAKIPEFNTIIGQRLDFSATDLERLNRMYNCSEYRWVWEISKQTLTEFPPAFQFPVHFPSLFLPVLVKETGQTA